MTQANTPQNKGIVGMLLKSLRDQFKWTPGFAGLGMLQSIRPQKLRNITVGLWVVCLAVLIIRLFASMPSLGIITTFLFMITSYLTGLVGMTKALYTTNQADDILISNADGRYSDQIEGEAPIEGEQFLRIGSSLISIGVSAVLIGAHFGTMMWPGCKMIVSAGAITLIIAALIWFTLIKSKCPQPEANQLSKFAVICTIVGAIIAYSFISGLYTEYRFRDYPAYLEALDAYKADTQDREKEAKYRLEFAKMKISRDREDPYLKEEIRGIEEYLANPTDENYDKYLRMR